MKRSTRILSIIMAIAMIVSSMVVVASADATPTISVVADEAGIVDGQISVDIVVANNPGVISMKLDLNYDEGLTIASVTDGDILGDCLHSDNLALNPYQLFWSNPTNGGESNPSNIEEDGVIATVVFNVSEDLAPGEYEISVDYNENADDEIFNAALANVAFDIEAAKATIVIEEPVVVEEIVLNEEELVLTEGDSFTLEATVLPEEAEYDVIEWTSDDEDVATVENGVVTAVAAGTATITAAIGDIKAECAVTVNAKEIPVASIELNKTEAALTVDDTLQLEATVSPADATDSTVAWSVEGDAVTVDDGLVTAVKAGTATVTAQAGDKTATCVVTVNAPVVEEPVAQIGTKTYTSVAEALAAAKSGDEVVMIADSTESVIMINPGVTLNIGTYTLTASNVIGFNGSKIYGANYSTSAYGKIVVPKDNVILTGNAYVNDADEPIVPIWVPSENCYVFTKFRFEMAHSTTGLAWTEATDESAESVAFRFQQNVDARVLNELLSDGNSDNALKLVVHLEWLGEDGTYKQDYVYNDYFVGFVSETDYSRLSYVPKYGYTYNGIFKFTLMGYESLNIDPNGLSVSAMLVSDTGVSVVGDIYTSAGVQ